MSALMVASVATTALTSVSAADVTNPYEIRANEFDQKAYLDSDLGATYSPASTTFKVWSPSATVVELNLYTTGTDSENGAEKISTTPMTQSAGNNAVWEVTVTGDQKNVYYTYTITATDEKGVSVTNETADIYAKAAGANGNRSMVVDLADTDPTGWDTDSFDRVTKINDANVWEIHVKDFSYDASSGVSEANRGKYLAFTEDDTTLNNEGTFKTGTAYLKDLGVNYVHVNPFYDYGSIDETGADTQFNWGYDPKNYNVPEGSYSSNPYDGNVRINETKQMVQGLHKEGIGVIMDVVYNHTYVTDSFFQKTVPDYYYRIKADGTWSNGSGCGNDTASEREMYRQFMIDSVKYWATEYHIDGFRFDLMGLHDAETMNAIRTALDEIDPSIIMYGEGWTMGSEFDQGTVPATQANAAQIDSRIAFFNDQIRDGIKGSVFDQKGKGYVQGVKGSSTAIALGLLANTTGGNWKANQPSQTITYDSCHDNNTFYDRMVMSLGGEFDKRYEEYVAMNKLSAAIVYGSQGMPFILAGEEFARTKLGDHNSYMSSPDINKLDWTRVVKYQDLVSYYQGLIEFRNFYEPIRTATNLSDGTVTVKDNKDGTIIAEYNTPDAAWKNVIMLFNDNAEAVTMTIPEGNFVILANDQAAGVANLGDINGGSVSVAACSAMFLVDRDSFDTAGATSDRGTVTVQYVNEKTNMIMSKVTIQGKIGTAYQTSPSDSYGVDYILVGDTGNTSGTFEAEPQTVVYTYTPNLLEPKDLNDDNNVDMEDVLLIQKHIAKILTLSADQLEKADVNRDGAVDMWDVVMYQRYVAGFVSPTGVGTITVNYLDQSGKSISESTVIKKNIGDAYSVSPQDISYYVYDDTKAPKNASGKVMSGNIEVNYYYNYQAITSTIHVKVPDGITAVPNLYVWEASGECLGGWPGKAMTSDGDGWYSISFPNGGTYNWIVNGLGGQTGDQKDYSGDLWVIMQDGTTVGSISTTAPD